MANYRRVPWRRNHKCEHPSRLVFLDTETYGYKCDDCTEHIVHRLRLGVLNTWVFKTNGWVKESSRRFKTADEFWGMLYDFLRSRRPTWIYGHNIAFDFTVLQGWRELDRGKLRIFERNTVRVKTDNGDVETCKSWRGKTALDGSPFILECRTDRGPVKFVDSYNYFPVPLAKLGKWVGCEKLQLDEFDADDESLFRYCERDTEIVETAILKLMNFWSAENLGNWQYTTASLAFSSYRHGKEKCTIVAHGDNEDEGLEQNRLQGITGIRKLTAKEVTDIERRCYYGGRVGVFFCGDVRSNFLSGYERRLDLYCSGRKTIQGPVVELDVNSMYGHAMVAYKHPYEIIDSYPMPQRSLWERMLDRFWCAADVEIDTDDSCYPKAFGNHVGFPTGHFTTSLCGEELRLALLSGRLRAVANLCVYHSGHPFNSFIGYWSKRKHIARSSGNDIEERFASDMMRSLYGKFAQRTPLWITCGLTVPPVRWGTYIGKAGPSCPASVMRALAGVSQYRGHRKLCRHSFVAAAASITSAARANMMSLINLCPRQSIVYMDTDSLFCLPPALETFKRLNLLDQNEIGKLKVKRTINELRIWGQKDYERDGVRVIAGLKSDATELSERVWKQVNIDGVKQTINHDPDGSLLSKMVKFAPHGCLQSVSVDLDGWTRPLRVE